jgi:serine protease Do
MQTWLKLILSGIVGGVFVLSGMLIIQKQQGIQFAGQQANPAMTVNRDLGTAFPFDFKQAAALSTPAVVRIVAEESDKVAEDRLRNNRQRMPRGFEDLFGGDFFDFSPYGGSEFYKQRGAGSGVIYSSDGYIVTNNHVVGFADKIEVTLPDKRTFKATKIGTDPSTDLAVIKIEATNLPTLKIGDSDKASVGEWVLAVGNPFEYLTSTVTAGIISAKGRNLNIIQDQRAIEEFIQTDAAVNPGNSGGALVDDEGNLIGINTAIATPTGSYAGYSFAIPSNLMRKVVDEIIVNGDIEGATLGVSGYTITEDVQKQFGLKTEKGFYVEEVASGSSAQFAGLLPGDIIVKIEDSEINAFEDLVKVLKFVRVGDSINVRVLRDNKPKDITVKLRKGV